MGLATVFFETAASALFLARFGASALPYVYLAAALLNTATGLVYTRVQDARPLRAAHGGHAVVPARERGRAPGSGWAMTAPRPG